MALFKFFKKQKKEEIIDLNQIEENQKNIDLEKTNQNIKVEENKEEVVLEQEKKEEALEFNFSDTIVKVSSAKKEIPSIIHEYYLAKIFSRVALDEKEFSAQVVELDKQIDKIKNSIYDIERSIDFYKKVNNQIIEEELRINERVEKVLLNQKALKQRFLDINNMFYKQLKITTVSVCINKTNEQLEDFFNLINGIVGKYKSMTDAAYNLYYSSGDFLVSFIKELVSDFALTGNSDYINKYTYSFFLETDAVITLDINEWIDLYNKVKFAYKSLSSIEVDAYLRIKEKYNYFEAVYTILMMQAEISNNNK